MSSSSTTLQQPVLADEKTSEEDDEGIRRPKHGEFPGGTGPCIQVEWAGKMKEFCDGFGLCSATRWRPKDRLQRNEFAQAFWELLVSHVKKIFPDQARAVFKLAVGKTIEQPFTDNQLQQLREDWFKLLPNPDEARRIPESQPFLLYALSQTLSM